MPPIGAHVSIAGGYLEAFKRAQAIGADAMQIFTKSPRGGALRKITKEEATEIKNWKGRSGVRKVVIHASYLLNFAKPLKLTDFESRSLLDDLESADLIEADGVVLHIGKTLKLDPTEAETLFVKNIIAILEHTKKLKAKIILENTAGQGTEMGYQLDHLGKIVGAIKSPRLGVCLDTQHAFAAGYSPAQLLNEFDKHIGLGKLTCVHLNDSKKILGSRVDRHEDIGHGHIGEKLLKEFVKEMAAKTKGTVPPILETPEEHSSFTDQIKKVKSWLAKG